MTHPALTELEQALAPIVDLSLTNRALAAHIPRLAMAFEALRPLLAEAPPGSLENLARSRQETGPRGRSRSAATLAALADVEAGMSVSAAARRHGVLTSTVFRARAQDGRR